MDQEYTLPLVWIQVLPLGFPLFCHVSDNFSFKSARFLPTDSYHEVVQGSRLTIRPSLGSEATKPRVEQSRIAMLLRPLAVLLRRLLEIEAFLKFYV
jgi:hypothetical protein